MEKINKILEKVTGEIKPLPRLSFRAVPGEGGLFDCKLGGVPYFPKDAEYPKGREGDYEDIPLRLLVQLNFEKLPHIGDFPEKGILQIFIMDSDDAIYGWDDGKINNNGYRVIYHENIINDETKLLTADDMPEPDPDEYLFPLRTNMLLIPEKVTEACVTGDDYRFEETFLKFYNEISENKAARLYDLENEERSYLYDLLDELHDETEVRIGGYPTFEQDDPRKDDDSLKRFDTLLFELLSIENPDYDWENNRDVPAYHAIWGDVGTGAFFIPHENLKKCDFSEILYNYDCG